MPVHRAIATVAHPQPLHVVTLLASHCFKAQAARLRGNQELRRAAGIRHTGRVTGLGQPGKGLRTIGKAVAVTVGVGRVGHVLLLKTIVQPVAIGVGGQALHPVVLRPIIGQAVAIAIHVVADQHRAQIGVITDPADGGLATSLQLIAAHGHPIGADW